MGRDSKPTVSKGRSSHRV